MNERRRAGRPAASRRVHADGEGFEPSARGHRTPVFKTGSFGRSDNHPGPDRDGVGRRVEDPL
ncbi:hypothetical protein MICRO11B_40101 [Micrococcus luteus]|nr:hypothetical protein MICRO11B_40101 [Micrococcus luteus]